LPSFRCFAVRALALALFFSSGKQLQQHKVSGTSDYGDVLQGADVDSVWTSYLLADKSGNRIDSYRGYLEPVRDSCSNLEVIEGATVTQILLDGNSTARGVRYQIGPTGGSQVCIFLL
jgi:hypothetical protein